MNRNTQSFGQTMAKPPFPDPTNDDLDEHAPGCDGNCDARAIAEVSEKLIKDAELLTDAVGLTEKKDVAIALLIAALQAAVDTGVSRQKFMTAVILYPGWVNPNYRVSGKGKV